MAFKKQRMGRKKVCYFTKNNITSIDTRAKYQRMLATAIKRARQMALLPYVND